MKRLPIFLLMIILPVLVVVRSFEQVVWYITVGYILVVSLITFGFYWHDKRQAQKKGQRIPEKVLHLLELIGGWPAAYLAQQQFRHKTSKRSYRILYWCIVAIYQYLALECLLNWKILKLILGK
ncbi:MAG TPA: DUF1294 domain-containing protein [Opitutae bacterium]|nr:DUF1294 domain-containing protein [Opitutae bacterium]